MLVILLYLLELNFQHGTRTCQDKDQSNSGSVNSPNHYVVPDPGQDSVLSPGIPIGRQI